MIEEIKKILKVKETRVYACKKSLMLFSIYYFSKYHKFKIPYFHKDWYKDLIDIGVKILLLVTFRESAKRQPLDAKILTPDGWTTMGELKLGNKVIGSDGKATKVEFMSKIIDRPIYEIETEDGRKTECDSEHLWNIRVMSNVKNKHKVVDIQYLMDSGLYYDRKSDCRNGKKYKEYKFALETVKAIELKERKLLVEPYFLGLWLGDGTTSNVSITNVDQEVKDYLKEYAERLGLKLKIDYHNGNRTETLSITSGHKGGNVDRFSLQGELRKLEVLDNKHIPEDYLLGSIEQRKAILEGLMDSDGTTSSGTLSFSNKNEIIVDGVVDLVRSLGGRANKSKAKTFCYYKGERKECDYYRVSILFTDYTPFRIKRKKDNHKLSNHTFSRIVNIKLVGNKLGRCIRVSNKDGLYITDDYLLTHNTSLAKIKIIHSICYEKNKFIIWTSYDQRKAAANLYDVVLELQTNPLLIEDFGQLFFEETQLEKKSRKKSINEFITSNNIKVKAYSTGQSPRGEVYGEYRPDLIILDDIETLDTIESEAKTDQVKRYIDELFAGLSGYAKIIVLGNRLIEGGSITYLENKIVEDPSAKRYDIPVVIDGAIVWDDKYVHTDKQALEINGDISNPEHHKISLETKKRLLGHQAYNREMLNTPITDEEREFKPTWYRYRDYETVESLNTKNYLTIDTAMSEKETADFSGFCENYLDSENKWNLKAYKKKFAPDALVDWIFQRYEEKRFVKIGIEKTTFTEGLKPYLESEMRKRNVFLPIVELSHGGTKKETRIRGLIPRYSNHSIYHIAGECEDLEKELYNFPKSLHDDVMDAEAYMNRMLERQTGSASVSTSRPNYKKVGYKRY